MVAISFFHFLKNTTLSFSLIVMDDFVFRRYPYYNPSGNTEGERKRANIYHQKEG